MRNLAACVFAARVFKHECGTYVLALASRIGDLEAKCTGCLPSAQKKCSTSIGYSMKNWSELAATSADRCCGKGYRKDSHTNLDVYVKDEFDLTNLIWPKADFSNAIAVMGQTL